MITDFTVFEAIVSSLSKTTEYNKNDQVPPAVVLWTDEDKEWLPIASKLRAVFPEFLTLGDYDSNNRIGPGIWIRCMIAYKLPEANWPDDKVPIIYLPGVSRQQLRAVDECPKFLQPIAELQYLGVFWTQSNAKDWTVMAFLQSRDGGLGLEVARDNDTREALKSAVVSLSEVKLSDLQGKIITSEVINGIVLKDPVKNLLAWLNDPVKVKSEWDQVYWHSFVKTCINDYRFDPEKDGDIVAGEKLGRRQGNWELVWGRFRESPSLYPRLYDLLKRAKPALSNDLVVLMHEDSWPQNNEKEENELRASLLDLINLSRDQACNGIIDLDNKHGRRREWVWADLGHAPLAMTLLYLSKIADAKPLSGGSLEELARSYTDYGWQIDSAVVDALNSVDSLQDIEVIKKIINKLYSDWLETAAFKLQLFANNISMNNFQPNYEAKKGSCILFADGLRYDVGQRLKNILTTYGFNVDDNSRFTALPTVTSTAKPAISPIRSQLKGCLNEDFAPCIVESSLKLDDSKFKNLLKSKGISVLESNEVGDPNNMAWTEYGNLDSYGHDQGWKLAKRIDEEVHGLAERIKQLLESGWGEVLVITDHGWLLMPNGLPKTALPSYLTETRWGRCAILKQESNPDIKSVPWYWEKSVRIAIAPGISCFIANKEYEHGGISPQECIVPTLVVKSLESRRTIKIVTVTWVGLICRVITSEYDPDLKVDVRTKASDPKTSLTEPKNITTDCNTPLFITDDSKEGVAAMVVLLDKNGNPVSYVQTVIGGR